MNKQTRIAWLIGSSAFLLFGIAQLVGEINQPEHGLLGPIVLMAFACGFVLIGLIDLLPGTPTVKAGLLARFRHYIEPRLPVLLVSLALLPFGVMFLLAVLSGSLLGALILLLVVTALLNILDDYRKKLMLAPLLPAEPGRADRSSRRQTPAALLRWLKSRLRSVDVLRGRKFEIVRIQPLERSREGVPADRPSLAVTVEISDRREYTQMALCVAGYFASTTLAWCVWFFTRHGALLAARSTKVAFGFSVLVPIALLVALSLKLSLPRVLGVATAAMAVHIMLLNSPQADPDSDVVLLVQNELPAVVGAWLLGSAALIGVERLTRSLFGLRTTVQIKAPE